MQLSIHFGNLNPAASVRDDVAELMRSAVEKFDSRIRRISVSVRDINGPKGGDDKQCRCVVYLKRMRPIVIEEAGQNYRKLLNLAADRVAYTLSQRVDRVTRKRRSAKPKTQ